MKELVHCRAMDSPVRSKAPKFHPERQLEDAGTEPRPIEMATQGALDQIASRSRNATPSPGASPSLRV